MQQADGYYPRITASMAQSGTYSGMIVSVVGKVQGQDLANQTINFQCSDGGVITMDTSQMELDLDSMQSPIMEAIGQLGENNEFVVRCRARRRFGCLLREIYFGSMAIKVSLFFTLLVQNPLFASAAFVLTPPHSLALLSPSLPMYCSVSLHGNSPVILIWMFTTKCCRYRTTPNLPVILRQLLATPQWRVSKIEKVFA